MDELDRDHARVMARRNDSMELLKRELTSLQSVSTPDLGPGEVTKWVPPVMFTMVFLVLSMYDFYPVGTFS